MVDRDAAYRDYEPWQHLVRALWAADRREQALERLQRLNTITPRARHQVGLGRYLARTNDKERARRVLRQALQDF